VESLLAWGTNPLERVFFVGVIVAASACAQQEMPPGGPEDLRPPVVVATTPSALEIVADLEMEIRFEFDERISERVTGGVLETAIAVSPVLGGYRVEHDPKSLTLKLEGGLRPDLVYRITLTPTVSDMFGNTMTDPFELVFSTGGEPLPTTLAGEVWDRISGRAVRQATLVAVGSDSIVHRSTADRTGIFAFRYLPAGTFEVTAFEDLNRNGEVDSTEVQGLIPLSIEAGDTLLTDIAILAPDTSSANLSGADILDSVTVALLFDDFLAFETGVDEIEIEISSNDAGVPVITDVMHEPDYIAWVQEVTDSLSLLDSIEAGEEAAARALLDIDTVMLSMDVQGVSSETASIAPVRRLPPSLPELQGSAAGPTSGGGRVLPGRRLVLRFAVPLPHEAELALTVFGVTNIFGTQGGGGDATFSRVAVPDSTTITDSIEGVDSTSTLDTGIVVPTESIVPRCSDIFFGCR